MKEIYELLEKIFSRFNIEFTGWLVAAALLLYILRKYIERLLGRFLDGLGKRIGGEWSYRRFDDEYRKYIREDHLQMKIVGIRTEEERRPRITEAYVPIRLVPRGGKQEHSVVLDQCVRDNEFSLILGDPGAGKSTMLDASVVELTRPRVNHSRIVRLLHFLGLQRLRKEALPLYIPLRRCLESNETLLDDLLDAETKILSQAIRQKMPRGFIGRCLRKNRGVVMLDGLDEVADEKAYRGVIEKVNNFVALYHGNRVVITCRKAGWRGGLHGEVSTFYALPLDSKQQYDFVHKWYEAILRYVSYGMTPDKAGLQKRAEREAGKLLGAISQKERLRELASNPLILSLICLVHRQKKNLPRRRAELYEECLEILLWHWDIIDKDLDQVFPSRDQKALLLRRIAHRMQISGAREIDRSDLARMVLEFLPEVKSEETAGEIVRQIEVRSGIISERAIDTLTFSHVTFQEFLVVEYFKAEKSEALNLKHIDDWSSWREPVLLMCGRLDLPEKFVDELYSAQPVLGILGLGEVDWTSFDVTRGRRIVKDFIEMVMDNRVAITDAVRALVGLLSVEGNPLKNEVLDFIHRLVESADSSEKINLIESLGKIAAPESASMLLGFLKEAPFSEFKDTVVSSLAGMGDVAIFEALALTEIGHLDKDIVFDILVACELPSASKILWQQYELEPPANRENVWARTWAVRLKDDYHDRQMRDLQVAPPGNINDMVWPYRRDNSSIGALVIKVVEILRKSYEDHWAIYKDIDAVSQFSLRVQIPLLLSVPKGRRDRKETEIKESEVLLFWGVVPPSEKREQFEAIRSHVCERLYIREDLTHLPSVYLRMPGRYLRIYSAADMLGVIDGHAWKTLGGFLRTKGKAIHRQVQKAMTIVGILMIIGITLLVTVSIRSALPPDGSYISFWGWLPTWGKMAFVVGILGLPIGIGIFMIIIEREVGEGLVIAFSLAFALVLLLFLPMLFFLLFPVSMFGTRAFEEMIALKKVFWKRIVYVLSVCASCAVLAMPAMREYLQATSSTHIWLACLFLIALIAIYFSVRGSAFRRNSIADWLRSHPKGREVLDEFLQ